MQFDRDFINQAFDIEKQELAILMQKRIAYF